MCTDNTLPKQSGQARQTATGCSSVHRGLACFQSTANSLCDQVGPRSLWDPGFSVEKAGEWLESPQGRALPSNSWVKPRPDHCIKGPLVNTLLSQTSGSPRPVEGRICTIHFPLSLRGKGVQVPGQLTCVRLSPQHPEIQCSQAGVGECQLCSRQPRPLAS